MDKVQSTKKVRERVVISLLIGVILVSSVFVFPVTAQPTVGGSIVIALSAEPMNVDPLTGSWNGGFVGGQLFESLLKFQNDLSIAPNLASSWSVDPVQGTYTFKLRNDVKWSDGQPFTSQDVKFSFENILSKYDVFGSFYFANSTVSTPDNYTAILKPGVFLQGIQLQLLASGNGVIYPKHILEGQDFLKSSFRTTNPVGTGPYIMKQWVAGQFIELVRNPYYWDKPKPYIDKITIKFISDPAAIIAGLKSGEINYVVPEGIPYEAVSSFKQISTLNVTLSQRPPYVGAIWFNVRAPIVSDVNVRRAISYALNRSDIIAKATAGIAASGQASIDPNFVPPSPNMVVYNYDIEKANSILDAAGYKRSANGTRFTLELLVPNSQPELVSLAQLVRSQLADVGISVSVKLTDFGTYLTLSGQGDFQMFGVTYWTSPIWTYSLFHSRWIGKGIFLNPTQYSNPQLDELLEKWLRTSDHDEQVKVLQQVEDIISQDVPVVVLYQINWVYVRSNFIQGPDIPDGKYVFVDSLANEYIVSTTTPSTGQIFPIEYLVVVVVAVVVIAAVWFVAMKRKKSTAK